MINVGIDQSLTSTGIVVQSDNKTVDYLIITSDIEKDEFERVSHITESIISFLSQYDVDNINIEGLSFGSNGDATRKLAGLQFHIVIELREHFNCNCSVIPPQSIKKLATGDGRSKKEELFEALPEYEKELFSEYKKTKGRYDITDAYWLSVYS